jgi:hypothetical protein
MVVKRFRYAHLCFIALLTLVFAVTSPQKAVALEFLSFGTGSPAGTYYFIGAGFSSMINNNVDGVRVTAESTAASTENARLMIRGQMDMGLACMGTLGDLKKQGLDVDKIRIIAVGHTSDTHWIVRKDSGIKSVYEFEGKTIGVGPAGSATLNIWGKKHLEAGWDMPFSKFKPKYLSFSEVTRGLRDKTIDAGIIAAGAPLASVMELARDIPIKILEMEPDCLAKVRVKYPNVIPLVIPAGTYDGIDHDVNTYCMPQVWFCRKDLPEDMVYQIIKTIYDNDEDKNAIHPMAKMYTIKNAFRGSNTIPVGFHPGAIKYYTEKGIWDKREQFYE